MSKKKMTPQDNEELEIEEVLEETNQQTQTDDAILKAEEKVAEANDKYLRVLAEYDNYRKRTAKEKQDIYNDSVSKTVIEFLAVIDNFERALATESTDEAFKNGIVLIFNQYCDILKKLGVEEIEALNQPFDPNFHDAINQVEDENFGENTVCQVFQKGYKIGSKVIRHSVVAVANP